MTTQPPLFDEQALAEITPLLTPREQEVMVLVIQGETQLSIAQELSISRATVKAHVKSIRDKLQARSMPQAAYIWGVIQAESTGVADYPKV